MKTLKSLIVLVATLVSFAALAADVQVFKKMSGESFPVFKESLEKQGLLQEEKGVQFFKTKILAEAACDFGKDNPSVAALHQKYGSDEKCQGVFIARNNLGAIMTLDDFRVQGQGVGFWLADISASPGSAVVAVAPKAAASESKTVVAAPQDNGFMAGLTSLKKSIDSIYKEVGQLMTKKEVEVILEHQHEEQSARNKEVNARFEALEAEAKTTIATVNALNERVNGIDTRVTGINTRVTAVEKFGNVLLGIVLAMVFALCFMAYAVYRKAKAPAPQRGAVPHVAASNDAAVRNVA